MRISRLQGIIGAFALLFAPVIHTLGQNALQLTDISATPEKAIQLHWASNSNEVYEIDYADSLIDTNTGRTTWNVGYAIRRFGRCRSARPVPARN